MEQWSIVFVALLACCLNEVYPWSLADVEEIRLSNKKEGIEGPHQHSSETWEKCFDKFTFRVNQLPSEVKNSTEFCVKTFRYQADINRDLRSEIDGKVKLMLDLTTKCALKPTAGEYLECEKNTKSDRKNLSNEIVLRTEKLSKPLKVKENAQITCLIQASNEGKFKGLSALYDFKLCVQSKYHQGNSPKPNTGPETMDAEFWENWEKFKVIYGSLKTCVLSDFEFDECFLEAKSKSKTILHLSQFNFLDKAKELFQDMAKKDRDDDTCVIQFIAQYNPNQFNLEGCLRYGYAAIIQTVEDEEKDTELIQKLIEFHDSFNDCRSITKILDTPTCIWQLVQPSTYSMDLSREISIKSDKYIKKLSEVINEGFSKDHPCIGDMFLLFQYDGLNMNSTALEEMFNCVIFGYKQTFADTDQGTLLIFKRIQEIIKMCTLHSESPGLQKCLDDTLTLHNRSLKNFYNKQDHYDKVIDESDITNHTCFRQIIQNDKSESSLTKLEKCITSNENRWK